MNMSTPDLLLIVVSTTDCTGFLIIALVFIVHGIVLFLVVLVFFLLSASEKIR